MRGGGLFFFVLYSTLLHLPPLGFHCADGSNPGPLQLVHWQSDALTTRLDLIQQMPWRDSMFISELDTGEHTTRGSVFPPVGYVQQLIQLVTHGLQLKKEYDWVWSLDSILYISFLHVRVEYVLYQRVYPLKPGLSSLLFHS